MVDYCIKQEHLAFSFWLLMKVLVYIANYNGGQIVLDIFIVEYDINLFVENDNSSKKFALCFLSPVFLILSR